MDYQSLAKKAAGNWVKFESFGWHDQPADASNFTIWYTRNRDSSLIEESNAAVIEKELEPFMDSDDPDVIDQHHGHWACGWVDGYAVRVYRDGEVTEAFKTGCSIQAILEEYTVLDDDDYQERLYAAQIESIKQGARGKLRDNRPDKWEVKVYDWLLSNTEVLTLNCDAEGYVAEDETHRALRYLGLIDIEEELFELGDTYALLQSAVNQITKPIEHRDNTEVILPAILQWLFDNRKKEYVALYEYDVQPDVGAVYTALDQLGLWAESRQLELAL